MLAHQKRSALCVYAMLLDFNLFIKEMRSNWGNGTMSLVGKRD